jgi:DNA-binding MarR family transcriptional regulator
MKTLKTELIRRLLDYVEDFESKTGKVDLKEFTIYMKDRVFDEGKPEGSQTFDKHDYLNFKSYKEIELATLLTGLFRFAKHYLKKTFQDSTFKTIDEFGFLANLLREESLMKNELISQHHLEMSTGSEVLKRLIKNGLIREFPDEHDKRAKRVMITDKGRREIISAFDDMYKVSKLIKGNISDEELNQLLMILNKLNYFHTHIWEDDKTTDLVDIYEKYLN